VTFVVGWKVNVLSKVEGREKREELRGEVVRRIIKSYWRVFVRMLSLDWQHINRQLLYSA